MNWRASLVLTTSLAALLAGCAGLPSSQTSAPPAELLAATTKGDIVDLLVELYPPAQTQLSLAKPPHDALGQALVTSLRERGYAIEEPEAVRAARTMPPGNGLVLDYRLTLVQHDAIYDLTVTVGKTRLSRVYVLGSEGNTLLPAGHWARRE